jgi:arginyl-tRNA synthetase
MENSLFPKDQLKELIWQAWKSLAETIGADKNILRKEKIILEHPADSQHGDYATNVAMTLFGKLKIKSASQRTKLKIEKPIDLAKLLADEINSLHTAYPILHTTEAAPPGFINFRLSKEYLLKQALLLLNGKVFKSELGKLGQGKIVVIDYSSPNIAKPFGIGHLRSTNIGQAIYNLYKTLGWKAIGDNHLGDWGTQFGVLIRQIELKIKSSTPYHRGYRVAPNRSPIWFGAKLKIEDLTIEDLERLYVEFHQEAEKNPKLKEEAREWFKRLEAGDPEAKRIWQWCVDISLREFARIYKILGVKIDKAYGESFYHFEGWMKKVLEDVKKKGLLKKSQGALIIDLPGEKVPAMLVKSDGATTYLLRDLAAIRFRVEKWQPDLIVYEVGADQKLHFRQVFAVTQMLGYLPKEKLVHIAHGMIRLAEGKLSTRKGRTIHLEEVIKEGIKRARLLVEKSQTSQGLNPKEKEKIAKAVGIGGLKFNDLKQEPQKDIVFDWDKILSLEGYSSPYLQYTLARCWSVLRRVGWPQPFFLSRTRAGAGVGVSDGSSRRARGSSFGGKEVLNLDGGTGGTPTSLNKEGFGHDSSSKSIIMLLRQEELGSVNKTPTSLGKGGFGYELNPEEEVLLRTFYRFPEVIVTATNDFAPNLLCQYLFDLAQKFNLFYQKHRIIDSKQKEFRLFLTAVTAQVLKMGLEILGIEVLERM